MSQEFSLTTFSSKGKLLQIEYALNAVSKGETALGIKGKNCVVLAAEKKISSVLIEESSLQKIAQLGDNIGALYAGLGPDFRVLCKKSRKISMEYKMKFMESMYTGTLVSEISQVVQEYTQSGGVRPFGVSTLIAGYDGQGPHLYQLDPSGAYYEWKATAIGKNMKNAKNFLEKRYNKEMELDDVVHTALLTLKEGFEGQMTSHNIEVAVLGSDQVFRVLTQKEIQDYLEEVE